MARGGTQWNAMARVRGKYAAPQNRRFSPDGEGRAERGVQKARAGEAAGTQKRSLAEAGGEGAAEDGDYQNGQRRAARRIECVVVAENATTTCKRCAPSGAVK